jgi:DNA-binding IclR family transcriptional regulator
MTLTATGRVLLARMSDAHVLRIARHANAQAADERARVDEGELLAAIHAIRHSGFAFTDGHMTPGAGVIATLAPDIAGQPPLAIGLGGTSERIRRDRDALVATMRRLIPGAAAEPAEAPAAAGFAPDAGEWVNGPLSARAA